MKKFKKNTIKSISLLITLTMVLFLFSGCGNASTSAVSDSAGSGGDQLSKIKSAGKIIVGIEGTYPPFTYHEDDGSPAGIDVELAQKIAEKLGVEVEFVDGAWDTLLIGVDSGKFDTVINCVGITDERKEKYDFTEPYYYEGWQIVTRADDDSIKSDEDLTGKKIATNISGAHSPWYQEHGVEIVGIDTGDEAISLLLDGRVDFVDCPVPVMNSYYEAHPEAKEKLKVSYERKGNEKPTGIPVKKGEKEFLDALNKALSELREDGTLKKLSEKYLGGDYTVLD